MIFYASVRGNADELAKHLLNAEENEHVTVHDIRGFVADDIAGALLEAYAISKGGRCKDFLFALSLNPPEYADVPIEDFEAAIEDIERKLGLLNQPRVIVFHEKKGRRHCHAVWLRLKKSDVNPRRMVGVQLSHFKYKLMDISRALFRKYGWTMPKGMERKQDKNPYSLSREEYRQAAKLAEDPQALKVFFKQSWETTDSKQTFARFLSENGFFLAQGDRRGYVAVDLAGKVYSLTRWIDISTRDLKARLGPPENLPSTAKAREFIASRMTENLNRYIAEVKTRAAEIRLPLVREIRLMTVQHRKERADLIDRQKARRVEETRVRIGRFADGVAALWERATGEYRKKCAINAAEAKACHDRDRKELHALVRSQLEERRELEKTVKTYRQEGLAEMARLRKEIAQYIGTATEPPPEKFQYPVKKGAAPPTLAAQIALIESKISVTCGEILQKIAEYKRERGTQAFPAASRPGAMPEKVLRGKPPPGNNKAPVPTAAGKTAPQQGGKSPVKINIPPVQPGPVATKSWAMPEGGLRDKTSPGDNKAPASTAAGKAAPLPAISPARAGTPATGAQIARPESRTGTVQEKILRDKPPPGDNKAPVSTAAGKAAPQQSEKLPIKVDIPPAQTIPAASKPGTLPEARVPDKPSTGDNKAPVPLAAGPPPEKSETPPARTEPLSVAAQIAVTEIQLKILSGDILALQASLESNLISDEMRARIRLLIEKAAAALQLKAFDPETQLQKAEAKSREIAQKQAEFNELVKKYAELQQKQEEQRRQIAANREFYTLVNNMGYALNGIPRWPIPVMMPESNRLDERVFVQTVRQRDNTALVNAILNSPANESLVSRRPPINPPMAVPALRANILQAQELLTRAGLRPPSGGGRSGIAPTLPRNVAIKFNTVKR